MRNDLKQEAFAGTVAYACAEFQALVDRGILNASELRQAALSAKARGVDVEQVLLTDHGVAARDLVDALASHYGCPPLEYDERLPVPPAVLEGLDGEALSVFQWMPVILDEAGTVVIAARNPNSRDMRDDVRRQLPGAQYVFRVALDRDVQWFVQDFVHARPGRLVGTERTGLAAWRNTMAQWRTRLACYRTDLAKARTSLAFIRWGLGTVALANVLLRTRVFGHFTAVSVLVLGVVISAGGVPVYLRVRRSRMTPPRNQTLVEVTAATVQFLESYHVLDADGLRPETRGTMLARLGGLLGAYSTYLNPTPSSKTRTMLARERNVLAAKRTIAACYRTLYARARTGLAFIRTGVSFVSLGIGLAGYFGTGPLAGVNVAIVVVGLLLVVDGVFWYWPVRKEQAEVPHGTVYAE